MARPKQFDRDEALRAGMRVFWQQGFAATTTDDLAKAMGIGRQSFYDTYGDKRRCYLEALRDYARTDVGTQIDAIRRAPSPLQALREMMRAAAAGSQERRSFGCMAINAMAEFGATDAEIGAALAPAAMLIEQSIVQLLREAKAKGEVAPSLDEQQAAAAIVCTRMGMTVGARAGRSPESLRAIAEFTVDQLAAR
ncbi:MAG TPA: TetR family transcriptional regulator [Gemmatirosa sp.]